MTNSLNAETLATLAPMAIMDRAALASAVNISALAVEKRTTIPVLANLRLVGTGESMVITGNNLDTEITVTVAGAADARFASTVPAHMLKDILAKTRESELASLDAPGDDGMTGIDMGGVRFRLQSIPAEDFPVMRAPEKPATFSLPVAELLAALDRVGFAMSTEETRYYLNGVYLHTRRGEQGGPVFLRAVATDGHRLAWYDMTGGAIDGNAYEQSKVGGVIVPRLAALTFEKVAAALRKAKALPERVGVTMDRAMIRFTLGAVTMTSKLVDGTYPDYQRVVPRAGTTRAVMPVQAVADGVNQVSLISLEKGSAVKFELGCGVCRMSVNNPDSGTAETSVPAVMTGEAVTIGFNARYVLDVLAVIGGADMAVTVTDGESPALIHDTAEPRFTAVLMPLRV